MLPYTPLHHLLLADVGRAARDDQRATSPTSRSRSRTATRSSAWRGIADLFLLHDRPIRTRTDDSVVRVVGGPAADAAPLARVRAGEPPLPERAARPILACGAELKSTFCLAKGARAWVSHHIGDLRNAETLARVHRRRRALRAAVRRRARGRRPRPAPGVPLDEVRARARGRAPRRRPAPPRAPRRVPGRARRARAGGRRDLRRHRATGTDGAVWGGELLAGDLAGFERAGHLRPVRMPGGEQAIRQPWRMACAWLQEALGEEPAPLPGRRPGALARGRLAGARRARRAA